MNTNIRIQRYIHTFMHTCMNSYIKTSPHIITSTTGKGGNDINSFIQSGYLYSALLCPLLLGGAPDHSNCMTVSEFTRRSVTGNCIQQGSPNYGARAGFGPSRSPIRPAVPFQKI